MPVSISNSNLAITADLGADSVLDYGETYSVTLSGLIPDTEVTWNTKDNASPNTRTSKVGDNGKTTMLFNAVEDYSVQSVKVSGTYQKSLVEEATFEQPITLKQYNISVTEKPNSLDAFNGDFANKAEGVVKIVGGKANAPIK